MENNPRNTIRVFPPYRLDPVAAQLWRGHEKIVLRRKTFDVLLYLTDHPGQLVTKAALLDAVWADVSVSDSMPATCVAELRKALGDDAKTPQFIETVHGRGYRFVANVALGVPPKSVSKPSASPNNPLSLMVGRGREMARLQEWYSEVAQGRRRVIFVTGEAGIGKTTIIQVFLDSVASDGTALIGRGQCIEQYGPGEPYMPVLEALTRLGRESGSERVIELLRNLAPSWLAQMPSLLARETSEQLQRTTSGVTQQRMLREMAEALESLAAEAPFVLLLEDLHWSDYSTLELISAIARRREPAQLLIIGTYRPVEVLAKDHPLRAMKQELDLHGYSDELRLKLLDHKDIEIYLARRLGDDSRRFGTLAPVIHARTDGNPLFMVNMIDYLVADAGPLSASRVTEGQWNKALGEHRFDVPCSIRQMIERNLERLQPEEQMIMEGASVAGVEFSAAAVAAALERSQDEVEACCARLSRREQFIGSQGPIAWPDGTLAAGFSFQHAVYREVLYDLLPVGRQVQFHRRIAEREERGYGDRLAEIATELAHHFSRANIREKAIKCFQIAAERSVARAAVIEAELHYRSALQHLAELPHTTERDRLELALQMGLGTVLWTAKSWSHPETDRVFSRAEELTDTLGDDSQFMTILFGLFISATGSGRYRSAIDAAERMLDVGERSKSPVSLSVAHTFLGETLLYRARYRDAQNHLELASSLCDASELEGLGEWAFAAPALLAITMLILGYPGLARELAAKASQHAFGCADPHKIAGVHLWLGLFNGILRDVSGEAENAGIMREMATKHPVWGGFSDFFTAVLKIIQESWEEAGKYLEKAVTFHESVGLVGWLNWFNLPRANIVARKGLFEDALKLASNVATHPELVLLRVPALQLQAELLARSNAGRSAIEAAYHAAINCAREQEAKYYELQAITSFARWLKLEDRGLEAQRMLAEIYGWFTEGFDTPALLEAKAILGGLTNATRVPRTRAKRNP